MSGLTREMSVRPQYDYRDDPNDGRGARGAMLVLTVRGPLGAVSADLSTGWVSNPLTAPYSRDGNNQRREGPGLDRGVWDSYPTGSGVWAHSYRPRESYLDGPGEGQSGCTLLGGQPCYGDGSFLMADDILALLIGQGSEAAFEELETLYELWIALRPVVTA